MSRGAGYRRAGAVDNSGIRISVFSATGGVYVIGQPIFLLRAAWRAQPQSSIGNE
jgi:hypothetical protein